MPTIIFQISRNTHPFISTQQTSFRVISYFQHHSQIAVIGVIGVPSSSIQTRKSCHYLELYRKPKGSLCQLPGSLRALMVGFLCRGSSLDSLSLQCANLSPDIIQSVKIKYIKKQFQNKKMIDLTGAGQLYGLRLHENIYSNNKHSSAHNLDTKIL